MEPKLAHDATHEVGKTLMQVCSTSTNLSYPALCGPLDDGWFGVRAMSVGLALRFDSMAHPLTLELLNSAEQSMKKTAVAAHKAYGGEMSRVTMAVARSQRKEMRIIMEKLEDASERFLSDKTAVDWIKESKYNTFWSRESHPETISPETSAFVTKVLRSLKKGWRLQCDEALDRYQEKLNDLEEVRNTQPPPTHQTTLLERLASLTSNILVLNSGDRIKESPNPKVNEYEPLPCEKCLMFATQMVGLVFSVRLLGFSRWAAPWW